MSATAAIPLAPLNLSLIEPSTSSPLPSIPIESLAQEIEDMYRVFDSFYRRVFSLIENSINEHDPNSMFDPEEELVEKLEELENSLQSVSPRSERLRRLHTQFCEKHLKTVRDLRWKILIRDGSLSLEPDQPSLSLSQWNSLIEA